MVVLPAPAGINHGAALLALGEGRLLACWYSGRTEGGPDAVILCSRSVDRGVNWAQPRAVSVPGAQAAGVRAPARSVGNVALARDEAGRVVMISGEIQSRRFAGLETCRTWRCGRIDFRISWNGGETWSAPTRLDDRRGALPRGRPAHVDGEGDLIPVYLERGRASVLRQDLSKLEPNRTPMPQVLPIPEAGPLIQPSLAMAGSRLVALLRDPHRRSVHVSVFDPASDEWSMAQSTSLPNPGSAVEAFTDARGRAVVLYNPSRKDRRTLRFAASSDGLRFTPGCDLVARDTVGDAAYPSVAPTGPASWGVAFSIHGKRQIAFARFDQGFLDACTP
jgi:hypothetical protein